MWVAIFLIVAVLAVFSIVYLVVQFHHFRCFARLAERHRLLSWILAAVPVAAVMSTGLLNLFTMFVVLIHLMVIWVCCDLAARILRRCLHRTRTRNYEGGTALLLTAAVLGCGWYAAHHVRETDYRFETEKTLGGAPLRAAMLADAHLSITLDGDRFAAEMERLQSAAPDVVLICGDFVDDDTKKTDMLAACEALGRMQTRYGIYYVYGNHDLGYYQYRDFSAEELRTALTENGVIMLEDASAVIDGRFSVTGRLDKSFAERMTADALAEGLDDSIYRILLDHQPNDYAAEAAAGFDLVLSGHTHGGHIWPTGWIGLAIGANDRVYGTESRGDTVFLVTSGISGWAIPFKTGTASEICVIDIVPQ